MAGRAGGRTDQLGIIPTQPSLAGVGAGAELGKKVEEIFQMINNVDTWNQIVQILLWKGF